MRDTKFDYTGMKTSKELESDSIGIKISARSEDGTFKVTSYIGKRRGMGKVYGHYNYQSGKYVEEKIR